MNILAFDTCMQSCSAAILRDAAGSDRESGTLFSARETLERGHAERLVPMIQEVMTKAALEYDEIDRIAVTTGPGTFTGIRIGVATARGLALASGVELVGENVLQVIAWGCLQQCAPPPGDLLAVAINARRGQIYLQLFDANGTACTDPHVVVPDQAGKLIPPGKSVFVAGSGKEILKNAVGEEVRQNLNLSYFEHGNPQPDAGILARHAASRPSSREPVSPLYLRPPDAKIQSGYAIERQ
jgi:tRNA threonylcarbamoyl adenosine modification protein YeaZ